MSENEDNDSTTSSFSSAEEESESENTESEGVGKKKRKKNMKKRLSRFVGKPKGKIGDKEVYLIPPLFYFISCPFLP